MRTAIARGLYPWHQPSGGKVVAGCQASALLDHGLAVRVSATCADELEPRRGFSVHSPAHLAPGAGSTPIKYSQDSGLEWFYRLVCEPHLLFHRYAYGSARSLSVATVDRMRGIPARTRGA